MGVKRTLLSRAPDKNEELAMNEAFSGSYPIEFGGGEIERLHIQGAAMAPDTECMLELIGVREGWSCVDIGCGPGGSPGCLASGLARLDAWSVLI